MLVRGEAGAVLIDLGVARFLDMSAVTAAGMTWGTPGYFSPEQWNGDNLTCHSDVFSLAVSLQEAISGHHPTRGDQDAMLRAPVKTSTICPTAPARLAELIDRCLSLRPAFRPVPLFLEQEFAEIAAQLG
jgi:serine/threonine protein kinase